LDEKEVNKLITFVMPENLIGRIDDYRFEQRFESRAETMRFLLTWALEKKPKKGDT
jgi:Arc/MetJ-type ribon-helix-helix transcriptional regulator